MKSFILFSIVFFNSWYALGQTNPAITAWIQNTTNIMGRHYVKGNSTPINDNVLANVQSVKYSATSVYIATNGIPAYITGPFLDGNPSIATAQNAIFKFTLSPIKNAGTPNTKAKAALTQDHFLSAAAVTHPRWITCDPRFRFKRSTP